jgi:hypothetical protein
MDRDVGAGLLHLGVAAEMIDVPMGVDQDVDVAERQAERVECRGHECRRRAENAAVEERRLLPPNQVQVDGRSLAERCRQSPDPIMHALKSRSAHSSAPLFGERPSGGRARCSTHPVGRDARRS